MKYWIKAFRLRTLPLALSGVILGGALANFEQVLPFILFLITALLLQITSNLANDLGDFQKGADDNRKGEERMVTAGKISPTAIKTAIKICSISAFIIGCGALILAQSPWHIKGALFILGVLGIWAAIAYTVGKNAYGYKGLGDVFVLIYFGLVPVLGSASLYNGTVNFMHLFPAAAVGLLASAVLNLNNIRDLEDDKKVGKRTLAVSLGLEKAKCYHAALIGSAFVCSTLYLVNLGLFGWVHQIYLASLLLLVPSVFKVLNSKDPIVLDGQMKFHALGAACFGILLACGITYA